MRISRPHLLLAGLLGLLVVATGCEFDAEAIADDESDDSDTATTSDGSLTDATDAAGGKGDQFTEPACNSADCSCVYNGDPWGVCKNATSRVPDGQCREPNNYEPNEQTCDGLDNDCDSHVDEQLTQACPKDKGVCEGASVQCANGKFPSCGATEYGSDYEATESSCDGKDNDCDGEIDENLEQLCGPSSSNCSQGTRKCVNGEWSTCQGVTGGSEEVCNGEDDDCDGQTDEGNPCALCDGENNGCFLGTCVEDRTDLCN